MLSLIKSKLASFGLAVTGILAIAVTFLYALLQKEKKERVQEKVRRVKVAQKASTKTTEAMVKGVQDENKPITRNGRIIK